MKNNQTIKLFLLALQSLFTGGCLVILFVLVPFWQQSNADDFLAWFSKYSSNIAKIMLPLEVVPLIVSIFVFYLSYKQKESARKWWLLNLLSNIIVLLLFIIYFKPANASLASGTIMISQVESELITWETVHIIRTIFTAIAISFCIIGLNNGKN